MTCSRSSASPSPSRLARLGLPYWRAAGRRLGAAENCVGRVDRDAGQGAGFDSLRAGSPRLPGPVHDRYRMLRPAVSGAFERRTCRHARDPAAVGTGPRGAIEREEATAKARNVSHRRYLPFSAPAAMRLAGDSSGTGLCWCAAGMAAHEGSSHTGYSTRRRGAAAGLDRASPASRAGYGLASNTALNGVSLARRKRVRPAWVTTSRILASPAWAPSASPTSCDSDAGVHSRVEKP